MGEWEIVKTGRLFRIYAKIQLERRSMQILWITSFRIQATSEGNTLVANWTSVYLLKGGGNTSAKSAEYTLDFHLARAV